MLNGLGGFVVGGVGELSQPEFVQKAD